MTLNLKLGTEVTFNRVIKREQFGRQTKPVPVQLPETLEGIIVGIRAVYDAFRDDDSIEPALSNRQTVFLVATSLHRTYKVFFSDVNVKGLVQSTPQTTLNTPSQTTGLPNTTTLLQNSAGVLTVTTLAPISDQDLEQLVINELNNKINNEDIFTAHEVKLALRANNPGVDIPHGKVRSFVHRAMTNIMNNLNTYESSVAQFGNVEAVVYSPAS